MRYFDCPLCPLGERKNSLAYSSLLPSSRFEEEILLESENFFVVPDAAPIVKGHVLVVAKNHVSTAFGSAGQNCEEIEKLIDVISDVVEKNTGFQCVAWEHGSIDSPESSGCVEHAHVHVLPCEGMSLSVLKNMLAVPMTVVDDMRVFLGKAAGRQYVILRRPDSRWVGAISDRFTSQCLRMSFGHNVEVGNCTWQERLGAGDATLARKNLIGSMQVLCGLSP